MSLKKEEVDALVAAALVVRKRAHSPYSKYQVGAAALSTVDRVYLGCNVENASYGLSLCAERNAIAQAVANGETSFKAIVVATDGDKPGRPCGACLQWMAEFCDEKLQVILTNLTGKTESFTLGELLPHAFRLGSK